MAKTWTPCLTRQWNVRRGVHKNPVQSVLSPSGPPAPQSGTEPGAMNSGSLNMSAMMPLAALLQSHPAKSTSSSFMCAYNRCRREVAASHFLATTLCRWTVQNVTVLGAPTSGLRRCPQITKALRPHVVLLVDSSMIGYLIASGRNVSLLRTMARSPSSEYALNWAEMCGTWSCASCSNTTLKAPHMAVTSSVGWRRQRSTVEVTTCTAHGVGRGSCPTEDRGTRLLASRMHRVVATFGAGFGMRSYPVYMASASSSGGGVAGAPVLACGVGRADMAENLKHCEGRESGTDL